MFCWHYYIHLVQSQEEKLEWLKKKGERGDGRREGREGGEMASREFGTLRIMALQKQKPVNLYPAQGKLTGL